MSLQQDIDANCETLLPLGEVHLPIPLVLPSNRHIRGNGTTLVADYSGPVLRTDSVNATVSSSAKNFKAIGGGLQFLKSPTRSPSNLAYENILIRDAAVVFDDVFSGLWMSSFEKVWGNNCHYGIDKQGGTTCKFINCHISGCSGRAWHLHGVYDSILEACAFDHQHSPAFIAKSCRGLTITGLDFEHNDVDSGVLIHIDDCQAFNWFGSYSVNNRLHANNVAYLVQVTDTRGVMSVSIGGDDRATPDTADGHPDGHTVTLLFNGARTRMVLMGSHIAPMKKLVPSQVAFAIHGDARHLVTELACEIGMAY